MNCSPTLSWDFYLWSPAKAGLRVCFYFWLFINKLVLSVFNRIQGLTTSDVTDADTVIAKMYCLFVEEELGVVRGVTSKTMAMSQKTEEFTKLGQFFTLLNTKAGELPFNLYVSCCEITL